MPGLVVGEEPFHIGQPAGSSALVWGIDLGVCVEIAPNGAETLDDAFIKLTGEGLSKDEEPFEEMAVLESV